MITDDYFAAMPAKKQPRAKYVSFHNGILKIYPMVSNNNFGFGSRAAEAKISRRRIHLWRL